MSYRQKLTLAANRAVKKSPEFFPYGIDAYVRTLVSLENKNA